MRRTGKLGSGGLNLVGRPLQVFHSESLQVGRHAGGRENLDAGDLTRLAVASRLSGDKLTGGRCCADGGKLAGKERNIA